jgi:hypothetical protein
MIQKMYADNNVDGEDINQENRATFWLENYTLIS